LQKKFAVIACAVANLIGSSAFSDDLLRVEGRSFRWNKADDAGAAVVTYALLGGTYSSARHETFLSAENCGRMVSFGAITSVSEGLSVTAAEVELRAAFTAWESVTNISFVAIDDPERADIVVGASSQPGGRAFANLSVGNSPGSPIIAKALGRLDQSPDATQKAILPRNGSEYAAIDKALICLNPGVKWKVGFTGNLDVYDLRYTFTHEIGHAIGLDHPGSSGSIMGYRYDQRFDKLQVSDIAAAQRLYGKK
jgi:hypothetical protein